MNTLAVISSGAAAAGDGSWTLLVVYFCLAIGISFFCSVWEAVLLSVTRPYIAQLKKDRPRAGRNLDDLKTRINRPLVSILTLNTIAHTMGAMGVASQVSALTNSFWETVASVFMTLAVLIASEIIPKNLGARHWKSWAPWVARCLKVLCTLMTPVVKLMSLFSRHEHAAETISREELVLMAEMGRHDGKLHDNEARIVRNLFKLRETRVSSVMTPRPVVFALPEDLTVNEFLTQHADAPFSRIPIYRENHDQISGFVLRVDVLLAAAQGNGELSLLDLKRDITTFTEFTRLPEAFKNFTETRNHLAIVHDEYGGMCGLVTMEDVMETLLGLEIIDELDDREDMQLFARSMWEKRAKKMGILLVDEEPEPVVPKSTE